MAQIKIDEVQNKVSANGRNYLLVKANGQWVTSFVDERVRVGATIEGTIEQAMKNGQPILSQKGKPCYNPTLPKVARANNNDALARIEAKLDMLLKIASSPTWAVKEPAADDSPFPGDNNNFSGETL